MITAKKIFGLLAVTTVLLASTGTAHATTPPLGGGSVPEFDASLVASSLTLLLGGVMVLSDKCRRR